MPIQCFFIEPTGLAARSLRRYAGKHGDCSASGHSYHNAEVPLDRVQIVFSQDGTWAADAEWPIDDPRWPARCACGYTFTEVDERQVFSTQLYRRVDTGEETTLHDAPPGAMWDAPWYLDMGWKGPDGRCICVRLPNGGMWCIDQPSRSGGRWTREGTPPLINATPSILSDMGGRGYHGYLANGELTDDLEGRSYDDTNEPAQP